MATNVKPNLLETKQADLTVGDSLKVDAMTAVVMTVAPLAVGVALKGTSVAWNKFRQTLANRKATAPTEAE